MPILSLIGHTRTAPLTPAITQDITAALQAAGLPVPQWQWLADGIACEAILPETAPKAYHTIAKAVAAHVDVVWQDTTSNRRKRLLLADMDSTIIDGETLDELAAYAGLQETIAAITQRAMHGALDFHQALTERVAMLKGLHENAIIETLSAMRFNEGAATLIATMRHHGAYCALASGGFTPFTSAVATQLGFDCHYGNTLEIADGHLTGRVVPPVLDQHAKHTLLQQLSTTHTLNPADALTVGDGANDLPMLQAAGLGVAWHAKPHVAAAAPYRLDVADLTGLLYLQGYRAQELVVVP